MKTVGAYEAKTHLPRLIEEVASGETITITKHGVPVAMLVPASRTHRQSTREVIVAMKEFRRGKRLNGLTVRELVDEGRRY
jgi:prevent-host-death family protein